MPRLASDQVEAVVPILDSTVVVPEHVVYRSFVNETVILNLQTGQYHGLNPTGGRILEALVREPRVRDAARTIADEFAQPLTEIDRDIEAFCRDLHDRGPIELGTNGRH